MSPTPLIALLLKVKLLSPSVLAWPSFSASSQRPWPAHTDTHSVTRFKGGSRKYSVKCKGILPGLVFVCISMTYLKAGCFRRKCCRRHVALFGTARAHLVARMAFLTYLHARLNLRTSATLLGLHRRIARVGYLLSFTHLQAPRTLLMHSEPILANTSMCCCQRFLAYSM